MLRKLSNALFGSRSRKGNEEDSRTSENPKQMNTQLSQSPSIAEIKDELELESATVIERNSHNISRKNISSNALKVLYRLNQAGYQAFLVGGSVRDLLLQGTPKDFDVSTDATPEEIKQLFRNSRIIGRRFKIVHIRYGREIIEATTFRAHHRPRNEFDDGVTSRAFSSLDSAHSSSGMILRDNVYGGIVEDALRRDFSINALYYTTRSFLLIDFADGIKDIKDRRIRILGDPALRYKEDPVRMLRAIRFAAKLNFTIEESTRKPLDHLAHLLESIAPARLFDESIKLLVGGKAEDTFNLLKQFKISSILFKGTMESLADCDENSARLLTLALQNTDKRLAAGKSITPAFLYAALLWGPLQRELDNTAENQKITIPDLHSAANTVISDQVKITAIPRRFTIAMREIWELQLRLPRRNKRNVESVYKHPRFRAAYDFLLLREEAGENLDGLGQWWTEFQNSDKNHQQDLLHSVPHKRPGRRRSRSKNSGSNE